MPQLGVVLSLVVALLVPLEGVLLLLDFLPWLVYVDYPVQQMALVSYFQLVEVEERVLLVVAMVPDVLFDVRVYHEVNDDFLFVSVPLLYEFDDCSDVLFHFVQLLAVPLVPPPLMDVEVEDLRDVEAVVLVVHVVFDLMLQHP